MSRQLQPVRHVDDLDRGRTLLQESRLPAPRFRRIRAGRVSQAERVIVALETSRDRHACRLHGGRHRLGRLRRRLHRERLRRRHVRT